jgi:hypothetical protein
MGDALETLAAPAGGAGRCLSACAAKPPPASVTGTVGASAQVSEREQAALAAPDPVYELKSEAT